MSKPCENACYIRQLSYWYCEAVIIARYFNVFNLLYFNWLSISILNAEWTSANYKYTGTKTRSFFLIKKTRSFFLYGISYLVVLLWFVLKIMPINNSCNETGIIQVVMVLQRWKKWSEKTWCCLFWKGQHNNRRAQQ